MFTTCEQEADMSVATLNDYHRVIRSIDDLNWADLDEKSLTGIAGAYYYFSVQFRENLILACNLRPFDEKLAELRAGEIDTDNLSPFPGVAAAGERMNHDEFMLRTLSLAVWSFEDRSRIEELGLAYLQRARSVDDLTRATSIASYEDGGLETVFTAILRAPNWSGSCLTAFKHFLAEHIRFDSDADGGHGALSRHMAPDDRILPLWLAFHDLLVAAAPALLT